MIKKGYAYEYTHDSPYKYQAEFKAAQKIAEANKAGLWGDVCNGQATTQTTATPSAPAASPVQSQTPTPATPPTDTGTCTIKGNINPKGEKIYHMIGCGSYNVTQINEGAGERRFCTEQEALAAGWRKALNCK